MSKSVLPIFLLRVTNPSYIQVFNLLLSFFKLWNIIGLTMLCQFRCRGSISALCICFIPSLLNSSHFPCHHRSTLCALKQVPTNQLSYTWQYVYVSVPASRHFHPPLPPLCPHSVRYVCVFLCSCPVNRFICTIFLFKICFYSS